MKSEEELNALFEKIDDDSSGAVRHTPIWFSIPNSRYFT